MAQVLATVSHWRDLSPYFDIVPITNQELRECTDPWVSFWGCAQHAHCPPQLRAPWLRTAEEEGSGAATEAEDAAAEEEEEEEEGGPAPARRSFTLGRACTVLGLPRELAAALHCRAPGGANC